MITITGINIPLPLIKEDTKLQIFEQAGNNMNTIVARTATFRIMATPPENSPFIQK